MRFTSGYEQLQRQLHAQGDYGHSGFKHGDRVLDLAKRMNTKNVLDYGCGQQTLQKGIPFPITNYDPFIRGCEADPAPHDLVVCSDVMEHIEPECVMDVLAHIHSKTLQLAFFDIAIRPAKKVLADGRNAHLIIEKPLWWLERLGKYFDAQNFQTYPEGGFVGLFTPVAK